MAQKTNLKEYNTSTKVNKVHNSGPTGVIEEVEEMEELNHSFDEDDDDYIERQFAPLKNKMQISWHNVIITAQMVDAKGCCGRGQKTFKNVTILNNVSGAARPGKFLSIVGASGAGKTTLLNHLSGRLISKGLLREGTIKINGVECSQAQGLSTHSAFIQQDDILFQSMTVRECIEFSAQLKLSGSEEEKQRRVDEIVKDLRLNKCQDTYIGGPLIKGVSGGERKRTSIGVELITNPALVFLDEPTTGLDSYTATEVTRVLRNLADQGRTIIQTIHQPNSEIFGLFDQLMLISLG